MSTDCIFCRIVRGEAPAHRVFEDEHTLAFMDLFPVARGHTLVIPKTHSDDLLEGDVEELSVLMRNSQRIARAMKSELGPDGIGVYQLNGAAAGQTVFHYHMHLVPRMQGDALTLHGRVRGEDSELEAAADTLRAGLARQTEARQAD
jgi:histidine triad (HIT) family protein